ncbi:hypothetical protein O181_030762 [Austropuccinia psidii MF-1]|uniref:Uncharacterized protein n=1 Tax=Austropuccinia psidii MF-1 TaxID=1389203 RepID=A0A9Q3CWD0_9BASI|nr:hypothetical protein [Austropuccinia psidii MF-1]
MRPKKHLFISEQLKQEEFNEELSEEIKEKLIYLLYKYKYAFETDKEPLGAILGQEVEIILSVAKNYPPQLRRLAYPASPRARKASEVHFKELIEPGVLTKVGNIEGIEVATAVIINWHNNKSKMVGDLRAFDT